MPKACETWNDFCDMERYCAVIWIQNNIWYSNSRMPSGVAK